MAAAVPVAAIAAAAAACPPAVSPPRPLVFRGLRFPPRGVPAGSRWVVRGALRAGIREAVGAVGSARLPSPVRTPPGRVCEDTPTRTLTSIFPPTPTPAFLSLGELSRSAGCQSVPPQGPFGARGRGRGVAPSPAWRAAEPGTRPFTCSPRTPSP